MKHWLMKSEPDECSIDDVLRAAGHKTAWSGVRNYQARNYMLKEMSVGDGVLFYHSSCPEPGIAGLAEVASKAYVDASQFDRKSPYYDPASKKAEPRWWNVDVKALKKVPLIPLARLRSEKVLKNMVTLRPGNRLSITPVTEAEWKHIQGML